MDHYQDNSKNQQRSKRTMGAKKERRGSQKLDISYLLNDTTSEERMDDIKRDPGLSRSSRPRAASTLHRDLASSSRGRADRSGRGYSNEGSSQLISCSQCRERFITLSELEDHKTRAHRARSFLCEQCGSSFSEKGNLNRHIRSVHRKEKPWPCPQCSMNFAFRDTLNRHVDAVHRDIRPFPCEECGAKFKKRAHLQRHRQTCHQAGGSS